jgi:hypothetical protein
VKGNSPSVTVSDGQQLWIYYPKFQSAEHYSLGKHSPLDTGIEALTAALNLENVENNYHITREQAGKWVCAWNSRRAILAQAAPQDFQHPNEPELQVQRTEMVQPNGDHIVTVYSNESRAAIDPANFRVHSARRHQCHHAARALNVVAWIGDPARVHMAARRNGQNYDPGYNPQRYQERCKRSSKFPSSFRPRTKRMSCRNVSPGCRGSPTKSSWWTRKAMTGPGSCGSARLPLLSHPQRHRARQMNLGATAAHGRILLFLHADTLLPAGALTKLSRRSIVAARSGAP